MLQRIKRAYKALWDWPVKHNEPPAIVWLDRALIVLAPFVVISQIFLTILVSSGLLSAIGVGCILCATFLVVMTIVGADLSPPIEKEKEKEH